MSLYESLRAFFAGYLHEDWKLDAESPADLVPEYIATAGFAAGFQLVGEISVILARQETNDVLRGLVEKLGSKYDPGWQGGRVDAWLQELAASAVVFLANQSDAL
jgi:hypothetical protein